MNVFKLLLLLLSVASDIGINFRATAGFVTDGANETYALGEAYPTTRGGFTFGWAALDTSGIRDRNAANDRRLAGVDQKTNNGVQRTFQVDLPTAGEKKVRLAIGDASNAQGYQYVQVLDDTTPLLTIDDTTGTALNGFDDATGTEYTAANWPSSNTPASVTFTTTTFKLKIGSPTAQVVSTTIAHLFVGDVSVTDSSAIQPILAKPLTLLRCRPLGPGNPLREVKYYEIPPAAPTGLTIIPDFGLLLLDGFSPAIGLPITLVPSFGSLTLTGFAAQFPTTIVPGVGALTLAGFGPSIGLPKTVVPGFGQLSLSGFPATFPRTIVPATGALDLNGFAPTFARTIKPGFGDLQLNGFPASFSFVSGGYTAQPGSGVLTLAGFTPTIGLPRTLQPGFGALVLSGSAPAVGLPITVRPALGQITLSGFGPTIYFTPPGITLVPGTGLLTLTGYAPFIGTFTFRIEGGPVMTATLSGGGVLVASLTGGPTFTGTLTGGPV